jgi:PadR family transcriptional regulator PadR
MSLGRVQIPTLLVLDALLTRTSSVYGWALVQETKLGPGTVYPILKRLETHGWITSRWTHGGARRCYRLVEEHRAEATQLVADRLPLRTTAAGDA